MKTIAFVILTWNSENYIENCIDSLLTVNSFIKHIYIVDNGSTDKTINIIQSKISMLSAPNFIQLIKLDKNYGTSKSRNIALKQIKNVDYVCVLDSDTIVNDKSFLSMSEFLDANQKAGMVGPVLLDASGIAQCSARNFPTISEKFLKAVPLKSFQKWGESLQAKDMNKDINRCDYLLSACWLLKPEVIDSVGYFDEKIFYAPEDAEYCIRVYKAGYYIYYLKNASIVHLWQRISRKKLISKINFLHIKGLIYMFLKHGYGFNINRFRKKLKIKEE